MSDRTYRVTTYTPVGEVGSVATGLTSEEANLRVCDARENGCRAEKHLEGMTDFETDLDWFLRSERRRDM